MEVQINKNYTLCSDKYNYWMIQNKEVKKGKNAGDTREVVVCGYHKTIESLMVSFADHKIKQSEAKTVSEALEAMAAAEKECKQLISKITKKAKEVLNEIREQKN